MKTQQTDNAIDKEQQRETARSINRQANQLQHEILAKEESAFWRDDTAPAQAPICPSLHTPAQASGKPHPEFCRECGHQLEPDPESKEKTCWACGLVYGWYETMGTPPQTSHSPLPWSAEAAEGDWSAGIDDANGLAVVYVSDRTDEGIRLPKDAAFIVRACNNAQRLADALQDNQKYLASTGDCFTGSRKVIYEANSEAISQWEGVKS